MLNKAMIIITINNPSLILPTSPPPVGLVSRVLLQKTVQEIKILCGVRALTSALEALIYNYTPVGMVIMATVD